MLIATLVAISLPLEYDLSPPDRRLFLAACEAALPALVYRTCTTPHIFTIVYPSIGHEEPIACGRRDG